MSILFIAAGIIYILIKCQNWIRFSGRKRELKENLHSMDTMFLALSIACFFIVVVAAFLPYISKGYDLSRLYFQTTVILSTFFVIAGISLSRILGIRIGHVILLALIISVFMGSTGSIYQLFGIPKSINLNHEGDLYDSLYVYDREANAAQWIEYHVEDTDRIYSDLYGKYRLISQGDILSPISAESFIKGNGKLNGYLYIRYFGTITGQLMDSNAQYHDITGKLVDKNLLYNNGGSTLYY
jgi:uncharacterized membrane protein